MFDNMTHDKAYILGFLLTDGNVHKYTLSIELQQQDSIILEQIQNIFNINGYKSTLNLHSKSLPSKTKGLRNYSRLRINSKELIKKLSNFGIIPNKSYIVELPNIDIEYIPSILRGIIDGDGWILNRRNGLELGICSKSQIFLQQIMNQIHYTLNIGIKNIFTDKKSSKIMYYGNESLKILDYIYNTESNLFLNRKKEIYDSFEKIISDRWWTKEQNEILLKNYMPGKNGSIKLISNLTGKSYKAVNKKIWTYKLKKLI